jgi:hypothetical protein
MISYILEKTNFMSAIIIKTQKCYINHILNNALQTAFILLLLMSTQIFAQEETKPGKVGIHAGINSGLLDSGFGPGISIHYALRTDKVLQPESMLFFDSHSGKTFLSGYAQKSRGFGLAAGIRINFSPQQNWNPSLVIMPGIMYSSSQSSRYDDPGQSGTSAALNLGISNSFYKKHMVSLGFNSGENITVLYLKYGYWF